MPTTFANHDRALGSERQDVDLSDCAFLPPTDDGVVGEFIRERQAADIFSRRSFQDTCDVGPPASQRSFLDDGALASFDQVGVVPKTANQ